MIVRGLKTIRFRIVFNVFQNIYQNPQNVDFIERQRPFDETQLPLTADLIQFTGKKIPIVIGCEANAHSINWGSTDMQDVLHF